MRKPTEGLSGKARKCIVGIAGYTPRKRHPHEATPPANDLFKRDPYRPGIDNDMDRRVTL